MKCEFCKTEVEDFNALQLHQLSSCVAIEHGDKSLAFEEATEEVNVLEVTQDNVQNAMQVMEEYSSVCVTVSVTMNSKNLLLKLQLWL